VLAMWARFAAAASRRPPASAAGAAVVAGSFAVRTRRDGLRAEDFAPYPSEWAHVAERKEGSKAPPPVPTPAPAPLEAPATPDPAPAMPTPALTPAPTPAAPSSKPAAPKRAAGTVSCDQEMLKLRRIFLTGEVNDDSAKRFVQELLYLEAEDPYAPVTIFINSGGGLVHSGLAILDVMSQVVMPLRTIAYGRCFSIAAVLLAAGTPGQRFAFPHARLMIHEPSCAYSKLPVSDMVIKVDELRHTSQVLEELLCEKTGRSPAEVRAAVSRDNYMSVEDARKFGLIDNVVKSTRPMPVPSRSSASRSAAAASVPPPAAAAHVAAAPEEEKKPEIPAAPEPTPPPSPPLAEPEPAEGRR